MIVIAITHPDTLLCPNCTSAGTYVASRSFYVVCRQCHMTGPVGRSEEEAVELWNSLPRRGEVTVTTHEICGRCGCEIAPGLVHYCVPEIDETARRVVDELYRHVIEGLARK